MTAMLPALAGSNIIYGMGMLEMGMTMSYEQLLIDQEIVRMIRRVLQGISVNKETIALDVIKEVGASGNYLANAHTRKYMRQESSQARLIDRKMRSGWEKDGSRDMNERAREEAIKILETHKPIPLTEAASARIREIIEEAEEELLNGN
jgi:trimethylamine--corrinoid protein Co-methyltransferase